MEILELDKGRFTIDTHEDSVEFTIEAFYSEWSDHYSFVNREEAKKLYEWLGRFLSNTENGNGVSDSPAPNGALPHVGKSECLRSDSTIDSSESEHGTLENRIDSGNDCDCMDADRWLSNDKQIKCSNCGKVLHTIMKES